MADNELYNIENVIRYHIFKYAFRGTDLTYDDLYQIAYTGYLKAQQKYDPSYGKMSLAHASRYISNELIRTIAKEYKLSKYTVELAESMQDSVSEDTHNITANGIFGVIRSILTTLDPVQAEIIQDYYLSDKPKRLVDIAKEKGLSKQRIHQIKQKGIVQIKEQLQINGLYNEYYEEIFKDVE